MASRFRAGAIVGGGVVAFSTPMAAHPVWRERAQGGGGGVSEGVAAAALYDAGMISCDVVSYGASEHVKGFGLQLFGDCVVWI